jgi:hypothetical protein
MEDTQTRKQTRNGTSKASLCCLQRAVKQAIICIKCIKDQQQHFNFIDVLLLWGMLLVAQLVEALRYKPEGRWFDFRWCHWNFSLT